MSTLKEKIEHSKEVFKDRVATIVINSNEICVIDWKNKNGSGDMYCRFILNLGLHGNIITVGDAGYSNIQTFWQKKDLSIGRIGSLIPAYEITYLHKKLINKELYYDYDWDEAKSDIKSYLEESYTDDEISEIISELDGYFSITSGFSEDVGEYLQEYDTDYWEWIGYCGRCISQMFVNHVVGLIMACEQLFKKGDWLPNDGDWVCYYNNDPIKAEEYEMGK